MNREYVIVCNEHKGLFNGALLFWGHRTKDGEKRSFGGYTSDLDNCECYSLDEINNSGYHFPIFNTQMGELEFRQCDDIAIKISELQEIKWLRTIRLMYRP